MKQLTLSFVKDSDQIGDQNTNSSSQEVSRANLIAQQVNNLERRITATSGLKCLELFGSFSQTGLWAKTFAALLVGMEGWYSSRCGLTWKLKGTKSHRFYFQLVPLTHHTGGTEYGLLPTPTVSDIEGGDTNTVIQKKGRLVRVSKNTGTEFGAKIQHVAKLLPTPQAIDGIGPGRNLRMKTGKRNPETYGSWRGDLKDYAVLDMLPTPTARDYRSPHAENSEAFMERLSHSRGVNLVEHLQRKMDGKTSQLNPQFVLEMMGYPADWTLLPFLMEDIPDNHGRPMENGETNP